MNVDIKDENGLTPLCWAAKNDDEDIIKLLLEHKKVPMNSRGENDVKTVMLGHVED